MVGSEGCAPIGLLRGGRGPGADLGLGAGADLGLGPGDHCGPDDLVRGADEHVRGPDDGQHGRVRWRRLSVRAALQRAGDFEKAFLFEILATAGAVGMQRPQGSI